MRCRDCDSSAGFGDAMQLSDERHHVRNMLSDVTADDVVKIVVRKRIRNRSQIVNYIRVSFGISVDANRARGFVPTTSDIEDLPSQVYFSVGVRHAQQSVFLVGPYVVAQTVWKLAHRDLRINRHRLRQRCLSPAADAHEGSDDYEKDDLLHDSLRNANEC